MNNNMYQLRTVKNLNLSKQCIGYLRKCSSKHTITDELSSKENKSNHKTHVYRKIHPWKSLDEFSQYLCDNTIYNQGNYL